MLTFSLNNKHLALNTDTSVRITWRNPACNFESIPGDVGLGIDIPVNDVNRSIFGSPERFEKHAKTNRSFPGFEIRFSGYLLIAGTFIVQDANQEAYSGWLRSFTGDIGTRQRERFIGDNPSFQKEIDFVNKSNYNSEDDEFACPQIYNPDFFAEKGEKVTVVDKKPNPTYGKNVWKTVLGIPGLIWAALDEKEFLTVERETEDLTEAFLRTSGWMVNKTENGRVLTDFSESEADPERLYKNLKVNPVSPMLFLNQALRLVLKDNGITVRDDFLSDDENLRNLVIYNNFDITKIENISEKVDFVQLYYQYGLFAWGTLRPQTRSIGLRVDRVRRSVSKFMYKDIVPFVSFKDFVLGIQNMLNVFLHFIPGRQLADIIDREEIFELPAIDIGEYTTGFWTVGEKKQNTLKFAFEHDSNDMYIADRWVDLTEFRDKEKAPVDTWSILNVSLDPEIGEIRYVRESNSYAQYKLWLLEWDDEETGEHRQEKFIGWQTISIGFQNAFFNYGMEDEEQINTLFSTLDQIENIDGDTYASVRQKGNIRSELFATESFSPRLLFYKPGNQSCFQNDEISLDWEQEETGLLLKRWKNWTRFWSTRQPVETDAHLPLNMLDYIIRNIYRKMRAREGEFIIEEMETEFRLNWIGATRIRGYKADYAPRSISLTEWVRLDDDFWNDFLLNYDQLKNVFDIVKGGGSIL